MANARTSRLFGPTIQQKIATMAEPARVSVLPEAERRRLGFPVSPVSVPTAGIEAAPQVSVLSEAERRRLGFPVSPVRAPTPVQVQQISRQQQANLTVQLAVTEQQAQQRALEQEAGSIELAKAALEARRQQLERQAQSLVQRGTPAFNARVAAFNRDTEIINTRAAEFATRADEFNARVQQTTQFAAAERVAAQVPAQVLPVTGAERFTPEAGRQLVRGRVSAAFGVPALRAAAAREDRLAVSRALTGAIVRAPTAPVVAGAEAFTGLAGFGFGAITERGITEAERVAGRPFVLTGTRLRAEPTRLVVTPGRARIEPITFRREPVVVTREQLITAGQFAGELAGISTIFTAPKLVSDIPRFEIASLGERGEVRLFGKRKPLPTLEIELKPRLVKKLAKEVKPAAIEARVELRRAKPKPGEVLIELPKARTERLVKELKKSIVEITPARFKPIKPSRPTPLPKAEDIKKILRPTKPGLIQIQVPKPKPVPTKPVLRPKPFVTARQVFKVSKPTKVEATRLKSIIGEVRAAEIARAPRITPAKAIKPVAEFQRIPGAALTLGLRAGVKREKALKPLPVEIELFQIPTPKAAKALQRIELVPKLKTVPLARIGLIPAAKPKAKVKIKEKPIVAITPKLELKPTPVTKPKETAKAVEALSRRVRVIPKEITRAVQLPILRRAARVREAEAVRRKTIQRVLTIPRPIPIRRPPARIPREKREPPRRPPVRPLPLLPLPEIIAPTAMARQFGFQVLVRTAGRKVKGKFVPGKFAAVSPFVFPRETALAFGQSQVEAKAKRTFKLVPTFGTPGRVTGIGRFRPERFKRKGRTFTERTRFAIDTPGELAEITLKGVRAPRKRLPAKRKAVRKKRKKTKRRR